MIKKLTILIAVMLLIPACSSALVTEFSGLVVYDDGYSVREGASIVAKNQAGYETGRTTTVTPGLYTISISGTADDIIVFYVNDIMADGFATLGDGTPITRTITVKHAATPVATIQPTIEQTPVPAANLSITLFGIFPIRTETELMIAVLLIAVALTGIFVFILYYFVFIRAVKRDGWRERDYQKDFKE
jgi:hypothetical protein